MLLLGKFGYTVTPNRFYFERVESEGSTQRKGGQSLATTGKSNEPNPVARGELITQTIQRNKSTKKYKP